MTSDDVMLHVCCLIRNQCYGQRALWCARIGSWRPGRAVLLAVYRVLWYRLRARGVLDADGWPYLHPERWLP